MTRGIWGDPDRYLATYWSRWPDVWVHGDWASIDDDGDWFLHGRSDDTLKVAGKRLGPAEVESILAEHERRRRVGRDRGSRQPQGRSHPLLRRLETRPRAGRLAPMPSCATGSPMPWASRSPPRTSGSSPSCPRPAAARSSAA